MGKLSSLFKKSERYEGQETKSLKLPESWQPPNNGIWHHNLRSDEMSPAATKLLIKRLKQKDIHSLSITAHRHDEFCALFAEALPETGLNELHFNASLSETKPEQVFKIIDALPKTDIKTFGFRYYGSFGAKDKTSIEKLAEVLPHTNITDFRFACAYYNDQAIAPLIENLPPNLEKLDVSMNKSSDGIMEGVGDDTMALILKQLKNSKIKELNFQNTNLTDKHIPQLIKYLNAPDYPLELVSVFDSDVSEEMHNELSYAGRLKRRPQKLEKQRGSVPERFLTPELPSLKELRERNEIALVAKAGRLPELMKRQVKLNDPLTAVDLTTRSEKLPPPLEYIRQLGDHAKVFAPELWVNVNEMQKAWDFMSRPSDKTFLDGKNGRPSFTQMKQKAGLFAVRATLKNKGRRE